MGSKPGFDIFVFQSCIAVIIITARNITLNKKKQYTVK